MKIFLKRLLLFLIPIIGIVLCVEIYLRSCGSTYDLKLKGIQTDGDKIEVLALGNSHATYAINPTQFDLYTYNLAAPAQSIYFDKRVTLAHLDQMKNLKYVLISVDFHSLYFSSQEIRNVWSYYTYQIEGKNKVPFLSKWFYLHGFTPRVFFSNVKKRFFAHHSKEVKLAALDLDKGVDLYTPMQKGWYGLDGMDTNVMNSNAFKNRANSFNLQIKNSIEKESVTKDLEDFILQLKAKNITPILITTPCYSTYTKLLDKEILEKNTLYLNQICRQHAIQHWDYLHLDLDKTNFFNCDHLNKKGSIIFSKMLNERINQLRTNNK